MLDDHLIAARIDRLSISTAHRRMLWILAIPIFFDFSDIFTFSNIAPVLRRDWALSLDQIALITSAGFLGMAGGGALGGIVADRIGRVRAMMLFTAAFSLCSLATAFSINATMLAGLRFATGLGVAAATVTVITYIAEMYPAPVRGRWQSWATVIALSAISVTSWIARLVVPMGGDGWRWIFIYGSLGLPFLILTRRLNESPRWLMRKGRLAEAAASLRKFETEVERWTGPSRQILSRPAIPQAPTLGWTALFSPAYIRPTLVLCGIWFFQTIGFYGFMSWVPTLLADHGFEMVQSLNFITLINAGALPGALLAVFLADKVERKYSIGAVALAIAIFGLIYGLTFEPVMIVLFGFLASTLMDTFAGLCLAYTPEQYPTDVRTSGTGLAYGVGRLANVVNPFVVSAILVHGGYQFVFGYIAGAWVVTAMIALVFGARTTGRTLEVIATFPQRAESEGLRDAGIDPLEASVGILASTIDRARPGR